jgi:type I restriction enzyme S subunit
MSKWPIKAILDVTDLLTSRVGTFAGLRQYVSTGSVDAICIVSSESVTYDNRPSRADLVAKEGDVLFARMQGTDKVLVVTSETQQYLWSTGFAVLRPKIGTNSMWLQYWLRSRPFIERKDALCSGATQKAITNDGIRELTIPFPPYAEQERMVRILDEVEELRSLRDQADKQTGRVTPAVFDALFGSTGTEKRDFPSFPISELCSFVSGATPSTENPDFWSGLIPWVCPKDMKVAEIIDVSDHISDSALLASRLRLLPEGTLLIVIRGMILAHTFPVAIARVPVTINQDMKGLILRDAVIPEYMLWCLKALSPKFLSLVSTAGHGTKRIDMNSIAGLQIPVPPLKLQQEFVARLAEIRAMETAQITNRQRLNDLFQSLLHRAFQGEL